MYNKLPVCDYAIASGSLSYRSADPDFVFKAIARLYENCTLGLGFNLLKHIPVNELIMAYNPQVILAYCHTLSAKCMMLDDYAKDDFTILMYH